MVYINSARVTKQHYAMTALGRRVGGVPVAGAALQTVTTLVCR